MAFIATAAIVGGSIAVAGGVAKLGMSLAGRRKRIQEQTEANQELQEQKQAFESLDTSNVYADVENKYANIQTEFENVYEDMTVNQQQAQFEKQMFQQQQANIMQGLKGAAGGSGIAALAQTMANQGQIGAQRISASIGAQESAQQMAKAQGAAGVQRMEQAADYQVRAGEAQAEAMRLSGEETARGLEWQKTGTLLGMAQQRKGAADAARQQAKAEQMSAVGDIAAGGGQIAQGAMMKKASPGVTPMNNVNPEFMSPAEGFAKTNYGNQQRIVPFDQRFNMDYFDESGLAPKKG